MSVNTDFVAALPVATSANKQLLRNALYMRQPYVLADTDLPTDLIAVDPASGAAIIDIFYLGRNFHYDPTDTTSANDGVSVLVSNEGRRYKLSDAAGVFAFAVINATTSVPPVSPSIGDAYLVASGATGAWAGQDNNVATRTRRGWEFIVYGVGRLLYVENTDSYMHKTSGGSWELGFGTQALTAGSVPITAVLGAKASFVIKVENQTTNAPPASPATPTAYIIGPSPTGAWAGNAAKLAICLVNGAFTIITPLVGDQVYDKAQNINFTFNGTSWVSSSGTWTLLATLTASGSANLQDTTHINATYNDYMLAFDNLVPSASSVSFELQLFVGGTLQTANYSAVFMFANTSGVGVGGSGSQAFINLSLAELVPTSNPGLSGDLIIRDASSTAHAKAVNGLLSYQIGVGASARIFSVHGSYVGSNAAITGFEVVPSSGFIASGSIKLYGRL